MCAPSIIANMDKSPVGAATRRQGWRTSTTAKQLGLEGLPVVEFLVGWQQDDAFTCPLVRVRASWLQIGRLSAAWAYLK
jgi:hypothetical protein